jgi:peptidoglycan/LPS O-acetylase OafA/YrhL
MSVQNPSTISLADTKKVARSSRQLTYVAAARLVPSFCILASHLSFHQVFSDPTAQSVYYRIFNPAGFNSVSFFIVLSGFILAWVSADRPPGREFQPKRLMRILPVHFLSWALVVCLFGAAFAPAGLLTTLTLVQGWFPQHDIYWAANAPAWTLSTELVLYLVFPAVHRFLKRKSDRFLYVALIAMIAVVVLLPVVLMMLPDGATFANSAFTARGRLVSVSAWKYWLVYIFPLTRLLEALCGTVVCLLVLRGKWTKNLLFPTCLLVLAIIVEQLWATILLTLSAFTIVPIVLLIGALAAKETAKWDSGVRAGRVVARISPYGKYTFGIYMYQWGFILVYEKYLRPWNNGTVAGILLIVGFYATCFLVAMLSYRYFEAPINRFIKPAIAAYATRRAPAHPA